LTRQALRVTKRFITILNTADKPACKADEPRYALLC
jgi:hypothetical protein